jgi:hypothetical protein
MSSFSSSWDVREVAPRCDRDLRDKPSTSQPGAPATDNQHYRGPAAKAPDVRPKTADPRAEGRFHARSQGARPVSELQIEVLKADTRENAAAGSAAGAYRSPISVIWNGRLRRT